MKSTKLNGFTLLINVCQTIYMYIYWHFLNPEVGIFTVSYEKTSCGTYPDLLEPVPENKMHIDHRDLGPSYFVSEQVHMCCVTLHVSWSTSDLRVRLVMWNRLNPSSKILYWPFQGGTSFVDLLCFFLSCVCYAFVRVCLYVPCGHLLGKGWPLGSCLRCLTVSLSHSLQYPGSGVVLDCIDSWPTLIYFEKS